MDKTEIAQKLADIWGTWYQPDAAAEPDKWNIFDPFKVVDYCTYQAAAAAAQEADAYLFTPFDQPILQNKVFWNIEWPALTANPEVLRVWRVDPRPIQDVWGRKMLLWARDPDEPAKEDGTQFGVRPGQHDCDHFIGHGRAEAQLEAARGGHYVKIRTLYRLPGLFLSTRCRYCQRSPIVPSYAGHHISNPRTTLLLKITLIHIPDEQTHPPHHIHVTLHTYLLIHSMYIPKSRALTIPASSKAEDMLRQLPIVSCVGIASHKTWCDDDVCTIQSSCRA